MHSLSLKLRFLRENNHYTQQYIASILGISQQTYCNYENGKHDIPLHHLKKLAKLYRVSTDYFLGLTKYKDILPHLNSEFYKDLSYGEFLELIALLNADNRKSLIDYTNFLITRQN